MHLEWYIAEFDLALCIIWNAELETFYGTGGGKEKNTDIHIVS